MENEKLGIYIHVPYCLKKCRYCDFVSFERVPQDEYFEALAAQIHEVSEMLHKRLMPSCDERFRLSPFPEVDSIFFGGGTPSLASEKQLGTVLDAVRKSFAISYDAELTIEVNPETVTCEKASELRALGFNRVSMGVQSFDDAVLGAMGRIHDSRRAVNAFETLRSAGFDNINLDLIFGSPLQNIDNWNDTLKRAVALNPEHISFYSLQLEEGTPLYDAYTSGRVDLPSWEENRCMYHTAAAELKDAGYHHYEVSNAAKPGFECRHNLKYWHMRPYLGFGNSAHSFINGCRGELDLKQGSPFGLQPETKTDLKGDFIFTELRLIEGFDLREYESLFGTCFTDDFEPAVSELVNDGLLKITENRIMFTSKGLDQTNPVMEKLLRCCAES